MLKIAQRFLSNRILIEYLFAGRKIIHEIGYAINAADNFHNHPN